MPTENVQDRDIWIGSNSDYPILVCARSDNSGRRLLDLLSQERALKRDESWKVFLVLCPITRDEVAHDNFLSHSAKRDSLDSGCGECELRGRNSDCCRFDFCGTWRGG